MGDNAIEYKGHVKMMAAVQPFLSGAISKTVNMPETITVEDNEQLHIDAWKMGLKSIAVYRDNCKVGQPLSMAKKETDNSKASVSPMTSDRIVIKGPVRRSLPKIRNSKTISFKVAGSHGYITAGEYDDGMPGEIFMRIAKQGSTLAGFMDALAISVSHGLQYGVPLRDYVRSFTSMAFAPSGLTDDPEIRTASSIVDYIFRRLALSYLSFDDRLELGLASIDDIASDQIILPVMDKTITEEDKTEPQINESAEELREDLDTNIKEPKTFSSDVSPICYNCGNQTQRTGNCFVCTSCGSTTGCS
jgi:ribonucleoside-diphosphate reductase alpha chain